MATMSNRVEFDTSATYLICVQGILDQYWSDHLGGMTISVEATDLPAITTLYGTLVDQAALYGVLNTLYNNRLPLLSVEYMPDGHCRADI